MAKKKIRTLSTDTEAILVPTILPVIEEPVAAEEIAVEEPVVVEEEIVVPVAVIEEEVETPVVEVQPTAPVTTKVQAPKPQAPQQPAVVQLGRPFTGRAIHRW